MGADPGEQWPSDECSSCGESHDGCEVEYCEQGEHCEFCCPDWPDCDL